MRIKQLVIPETLEEAYGYVSAGAKNRILGGTTFLSMTNVNIPTAVDLSKLGLNFICEQTDGVHIGAYTTLHELETSEIIAEHYALAIKDSVRNIVGVQFRNSVTAGAAVYSRYGFSDLLTVFLALNAEIILYKFGRISLEAFIENPQKRDILTEIILPTNIVGAAACSMRNSFADYAILNLAYAKTAISHRMAVGARPGRAALARDTMAYLDNGGSDIEVAAQICADELVFGTNMRAGADYRREICRVLARRLLAKEGV